MNSNKFKHVVLTRFNVTSLFSVDKTGSKVLTEKWLKDRFELFLKFCLPSFVSQKNQNFTWLVYFDSMTPDYYKHVIADLASKYYFFIPRYIDCASDLAPDVNLYVYDNYRDFDFIVTSRVDNDDIISDNFVLEIQKRFYERDNYLIECVNGCYLDVANQVFTKYKFLHNPFLTLVERNNGCIATIFSGSHLKMHHKYPVEYIEGDPLWMIVVHKNNVANCMWGMPVWNREVIGGFNCPYQLSLSLSYFIYSFSHVCNLYVWNIFIKRRLFAVKQFFLGRDVPVY